MKKIFLALGLALLLTTNSQAELTRTDVEAIVREFVEKNPGTIMESLARYSFKQQIQATIKSIGPHTPTLGPKNAKVTIVEYSEYQCPFCKKAQETVKKLRKRYKDRVRFAYKHLPLDFHPQAKPAALAAQAAHRQGKFWEYSDLLWERQQYLGEKLFVEVAKELKLDMDKFNKDRASDAIAQEVQQDLVDGAEAGARGTPYFLINGRAVSGARPINDFIEAIEAAFTEAETL
ncbi:MAG: thioredoxin domain-containing protein [Alphaproteobacteria bacterium]|nr:thioredoxin domain-containing protein [Alphaproteobacteria bacterium]MDD9920616.1 thioredoxin domain-containing protein [Alphaproteobacteria bacterium]